MNNFEFCNPVKVVFGKGSIARLSALIPAGSRVLMVYGGGSIKKNGIYDQVTKALEGFEVAEFPGIEPNPHYETCMKAVEVVKEKKIDFLLAVGGGSVIDATKFIAVSVGFRRRSVGYPFERRRDKERLAFGYGTYVGCDRFGDERTFGYFPCIDS